MRQTSFGGGAARAGDLSEFGKRSVLPRSDAGPQAHAFSLDLVKQAENHVCAAHMMPCRIQMRILEVWEIAS